MAATRQLEKIIRAYGKVLEELSVDKNARLLMPQSKLPYPKEVIRFALKAVTEITRDEQIKERLKIGLVLLDDFVPDKEVPKDFEENLKVWALRQKQI